MRRGGACWARLRVEGHGARLACGGGDPRLDGVAGNRQEELRPRPPTGAAPQSGLVAGWAMRRAGAQQEEGIVPVEAAEEAGEVGGGYVAGLREERGGRGRIGCAFSEGCVASEQGRYRNVVARSGSGPLICG